MTYDPNDQRRAAVLRHLNRLALDQRQQRLSPTAQKLKGALFCFCGPRLAVDQQMPDLNDVVAGVDRLRGRGKLIADRLRKVMRGRTARDADLDDLESLLDALAREEWEEEGEGDEEVEANPPRSPNDDPWREPGEDRRRVGRDNPPPFEGRPNPGGHLDPMENEGRNDIRFPHAGWPAAEGPMNAPDARDRLPHRMRAHDRPRRFGQDAAPRSFADRFAFTANVTASGDGKPVGCM